MAIPKWVGSPLTVEVGNAAPIAVEEQNVAAATPTAIATGTTDVQGVAAAAGLRLLGYSVRESAGTAAVAAVSLRHGTLATHPLLVAIELAANGAETKWFGPNGIAAASGVFVDRVTGETEITLYTAVIT